MNLRKTRVLEQKYFPMDIDISIRLKSCMKIKYWWKTSKIYAFGIEMQIFGTQMNKTRMLSMTHSRKNQQQSGPCGLDLSFEMNANEQKTLDFYDALPQFRHTRHPK